MSYQTITLREVEPADLETLYVQQLDPEANRMAAFVHKDPTDKAAFHAHWDKILSLPRVTNRIIVADGQINPRSRMFAGINMPIQSNDQRAISA